uniref:Uncharacterized protein n=1 Tax=Chromera velia CCMP2878 TaxID=1169474 RepID=A0A0G4FEG2_9ALVE|eukprot:Cvel_16598.t1-p1 / transcript=Cvel_16598.t1 / gene=Cvel_16598 / organism=Chromera_velia_CCMP2878 / gene_product=hypothetical protein / transcript_product=hypothetical protein / location=Cvel_scaffold1286:361-888(+) / protein_length=176 / sequence_SO=supercontig / SO=protein_coding / is_pseudo=false
MSATDGKLVFPLFVDKPDKDLAVNEVNTFSRFYDSFFSILDGKVDLDGVKLDRWTCDQLYRSTKGHPRVGVVIDNVFQKRKAGDYDAPNGSTEYDKYKKALIDALKSSGEDNDEKKHDEVEREWETFPALSRSTGTEVVNQYRNLVTRTDSLKGEVPMRKRADAVLRSLFQSTQDV